MDPLGNPVRLAVAVRVQDKLHRRPFVPRRNQALRLPLGVVGDEAVRRTKDRGGAAEVVLQPDHLGLWKVLLKAKDVGDPGPRHP